MQFLKKFGARLDDSFTVKEVTTFAALAAMSTVLQIVHLGWVTPWGMWIDLVAIPWIVAFFLYRAKGALTVSLLSAVAITFMAPTSWLGAGMKWLTTLPMWLVPATYLFIFGQESERFRSPLVLSPLVAIAIAARGAVALLLNYYIAFPIWVGKAPAEAMQVIPWWIIFGWNAVQGVLEMAAAWFLVFEFRLKEELM